MSKTLKIISPLAVYLPRMTMKNKKQILNLNNTRMKHYMVYNQCKKIHARAIENYLIDSSFGWDTMSEEYYFNNPVNVTFQYFKPTKRKCDKANVYAVHSKFVYDTLTDLGIWEDDNDEQIKEELLLPTIYDKANPRVEFNFTEIF